MSDDRDIRNALLFAWHEVHKVKDRPELTDAERERIKIAADILFQAQHQVRKRFSDAEPGTTTFSVLSQ